MNSQRFGRRLALIAGGAAIIAMGTLTACGGGGKETPSSTTTTTTTTTTSAPAPSPTEKSINPTGVQPLHAAGDGDARAGVPPGQHPGINGVG